MKLDEIARAYVAAVELDEKVRTGAPALADEAGSLRADLHALLMTALRENGIPFADRSEAASLAYKYVQTPVIP